MQIHKLSRSAKFPPLNQKYVRTAKNGAHIMKVFDTKSFGRTLRQRRKELNYTQAFLSEVSGFSVSFISDLENGKETAELGRAIRLANLLGLDCCLEIRGAK